MTSRGTDLEVYFMCDVQVPVELWHLGKNKLLSSQVHSLLLDAHKRISAKHSTQIEVIKQLLMQEGDYIKIPAIIQELGRKILGCFSYPVC